MNQGNKIMILFVNACVRKDSRTRQLAEYLLSNLDDEITEIRLSEINFPLQNEDYLLYRDHHCHSSTVLGFVIPCCAETISGTGKCC